MTGQLNITTADLRGRSTDVTVARQLLQETLNDIVAQTRADMSQAWEQWNEAGWAERNLWLEPANVVQGFAGGVWAWLESTWAMVEGLGQLLTEPFDTVDQALAEMGDLASDAKELFILVYHDEPTRQMLLAFVDDWWAAIPPDERSQLATQFGTQILADFVVGAVLAAFTAGTGALAIIAKWANRIHKTGGRIGDILDRLDDAILRLGKALKKRDRGHAENLQPNENGELESVWRPYRDNRERGKGEDQDTDEFTPLGVEADPTKSETGREMLRELKNEASPNDTALTIKDRAVENLSTGSELPDVSTAKPGQKLYKVVPRGQPVGEHSPFFMTREELDALPRDPAAVASRLGLPKMNKASAYDVYSVTPKADAAPKIFTSKVSPTIEGTVEHQGGAIQSLIPHRGAWTEPEIHPELGIGGN